MQLVEGTRKYQRENAVIFAEQMLLGLRSSYDQYQLETFLTTGGPVGFDRLRVLYGALNVENQARPLNRDEVELLLSLKPTEGTSRKFDRYQRRRLAKKLRV